MVDFFLNVLLPIIVVVAAFMLGWIIRGATKKTFGMMHIVEFQDGTVDMLIEVKSKPEELFNGQDVILTVHKTRR